MGRRAWISVLAAVIVVLAAAAWLTLRPAPAAPGRAPVAEEKAGPDRVRAQVAALQIQADGACRCARGSNDPRDEGCWADFQRSLARFEHTSTVSACGAESVALECLGPDGPDQLCVFTERPYGACSEAEARTLTARARARGSGGCG